MAAGRVPLVALFVRVPAELHDQLHADALKAGVSLAEHVRNILAAATASAGPGEREQP